MARRKKRTAKRTGRRVAVVVVVLVGIAGAAVAVGVASSRRRRVPQLQPMHPAPGPALPPGQTPAPTAPQPGEVTIYNRTFDKKIMGYQVRVNLKLRERAGTFTGQYQASGAGQRVGGTMPLTGNTRQTVNKNGVSVTYTVSKWRLTPGELSFRLQVSAAKGILSFDVLDEQISATRPGSITAGLAR